mgnify:CR=1 FL=1
MVKEVMESHINYKTQPGEKAVFLSRSTKFLANPNKLLKYFITPILIFFCAYYIRSDNEAQYSLNNRSIWDEAHFGKFAKYYITENLYHDVHPPLGKMMNFVFLKYVGNFPSDTDYNFESGSVYPPNVDFVKIRQCQWIMNSLTTVFVHFSGIALFDYLTALFLAAMYTFEIANILLGKFILLDTILMMFTVSSFMCICFLHKYRDFGFKRWLWSLLLGCSLGCVLSVKWVGLFIYLSAGCYIIYNLLDRFYVSGFIKTIKTTLMYAVNLILIPAMIYTECFRVHFSILKKSGPDDGNFPLNIQLNLEENKIMNSDQKDILNDVAYYSDVTFRSNSWNPILLHSHYQVYPGGSRQRQVTGYGHLDNNNDWIFYPPRDLPEDPSKILKNQSIVRIMHKNLMTNLHTHDVPSAIDFENYEVSGYGSLEIGDFKDNWMIELVNEVEGDGIYPVLSVFKLKNIEMDCYLSVSGNLLPNWGFKQNEIVCKPCDSFKSSSTLKSIVETFAPSCSWIAEDRSNEWVIEYHNRTIDIDESLINSKEFVKPEQNFLENFLIVNYKMHKTNNALVPDDDKLDPLASSPYYWPFNYKGLRMNGWGQSKRDIRYYLIYGVYQCYVGTICLVISLLAGAFKLLCLADGFSNFTNVNPSELSVSSFIFWFPIICYFAHYLPFILMARVTYVHHYLPCLFFKTVIICNVFKLIRNKIKNKYIDALFVLINIAAVVVTYVYFKCFAQGMSGLSLNYKHLELLSSWNLV